MLLNTGSSDMVIAGSRCVSIGCPLSGVATYDLASSTMVNTSSQSTLIPFGAGSTTGYIVTDTVAMGGISIPGVSFRASLYQDHVRPADLRSACAQ